MSNYHKIDNLFILRTYIATLKPIDLTPTLNTIDTKLYQNTNLGDGYGYGSGYGYGDGYGGGSG